MVCYRSSWVSYRIARLVVRNIKFISLVNLIMDREIVTELIQEELNTKRLVAELSKITEGPGRETLLENYRLLREKLGGKGASDEAARIIVKG